MRGSVSKAARSAMRACSMAYPASMASMLASNSCRSGWGGLHNSAASAGPANGSGSDRAHSSSASATQRSMPLAVRSLVEVVATRPPRITRKETPWCPASSTSSVLPTRTLAESSQPVRALASATSAPKLRARCTRSAASSRSRGVGSMVGSDIQGFRQSRRRRFHTANPSPAVSQNPSSNTA